VCCRITLLLFLLLPPVVLSNTAIQTDWSGRSGHYGPSGYWANVFHLTNNLVTESGTLRLGYIKHVIDNGFDGVRSVYAADIDGDGDNDVLGAAYDADAVAWWENTGLTEYPWQKHIISVNFDGARGVYAADIKVTALSPG